MSKIGVVITTFNSEGYFKDLYHTIPFDRVDEVVVVNGGEPYSEKYDKCHWIQHDVRKYASVARNDGLKYLIEKNCDYYFIIEDDMLIKNPNVFDEYIKHSEESGIEYLCFSSNAWNAGAPYHRTPRIVAQYNRNVSLNFCKNTCNEFTFRTKHLLDEVGLYDEDFAFTFDIDSIYRMSKKGFIKFWYFPDISSCDDYVMNNPVAVSRMNPNGERDNIVGSNYILFKQKHGLSVHEIPDTSREDFINFIKSKKPNK